jgi:hypothetical protein
MAQVEIGSKNGIVERLTPRRKDRRKIVQKSNSGSDGRAGRDELIMPIRRISRDEYVALFAFLAGFVVVLPVGVNVYNKFG